MAVEILMAALLLEKSRNNGHKLDIPTRFVTETYLRTQMLSEKIKSSDILSIEEYRKILD